MKILISADMEGVSGVVHGDRETGSDDGQSRRLRRLMTGDVNAAVAGCFEGGADHVTVTDAHGSGANVLIEELDPRAILNSGVDAPLAMLQGVDDAVDGVILLGYHGASGSIYAVLDHTWSSDTVSRVRVNGLELGEIGLNAALAAEFNVPVIAVSGDRGACAEATRLLGEALPAATVKVGHAQHAAECMPIARARQLIHSTACSAVTALRQSRHPPLFQISAPVLIEIEFAHSRFADRAALMPGCERISGRTAAYQAPDMAVALRAFRSMTALARD